jgi:hypothetical protein
VCIARTSAVAAAHAILAGSGYKPAMHRGLLLTILLTLAGCPPPYKPYCHVTDSTQLSATQNAAFALRPRGQFALLSTELTFTDDGGLGARIGRAQLFDRAGGLVSNAGVSLPPPSGFFDVFGLGTFVDTPGGFAVLNTTRDRTPRDGGAEVFVRRSVELRSFDGGVVSIEIADGGCIERCSGCSCEPLGFSQLSRVGDGVVIDSQAGGLGFLGDRVLQSVTAEGVLLPKVLKPSSGALIAGVDALALFPGPQLYSAQLEPISTPPDPPLLDGTGVAWSLGDEELVAARIEDFDLLLERYDFNGARTLDPVRVSEGYEIVSAARSAHGVGVLFHDFVYFDDGGGATQVWFAFVDHDGHKRGPDVAISAGVSGVLSSSSEDDQFSIFTPTSAGVDRIQVICE